MKKRDGNILKHITKEINLSSRVVKSKKVYSRKNLKIEYSGILSIKEYHSHRFKKLIAILKRLFLKDLLS